MKRRICELCKRNIELGTVEKHHIIPVEVTRQAGLRESRIITLCNNCHQELHSWYSAKVSNVSYDTRKKRFQPKSWLELYREYESTFDSFVRYKTEQIAHKV